MASADRKSTARTSESKGESAALGRIPQGIWIREQASCRVLTVQLAEDLSGRVNQTVCKNIDLEGLLEPHRQLRKVEGVKANILPEPGARFQGSQRRQALVDTDLIKHGQQSGLHRDIRLRHGLEMKGYGKRWETVESKIPGKGKWQGRQGFLTSLRR